MLTSKRFTIVEKPEYRVDLEYNDMYAILHLPYVGKFTKSVYQDMQITVQDIYEFIKTIEYVGMWIAIDPFNKVLNKFVQRIGFVHLGEADNMSVYQYEGEK